MVRSAWFACIALTIAPAAVSAEPPATPSSATLGAEVPPVAPRLLLTWPIEPKRLSFQLAQPVLGANGLLQPYRFEALWLQHGPLELRSFRQLEQSAALEHSTGLEARFLLGTTPAVPETPLFARSAAVRTPVSTQWRLGFGLVGSLGL